MGWIICSFRARQDLILENLALRQQLLAEGYAMKEVAGILGIKAGTVAFHKYRIMNILGVKTTAGLINYAVGHHMTDAKGDSSAPGRVGRMASYH